MPVRHQMNVKNNKYLFIVVLLFFLFPTVFSSCNHVSNNHGDVSIAVEKTLSKPGPVKEDLIDRGLVTYPSQSSNTTSVAPGMIKTGEIEELVKKGTYIIDKDGYLQFGPSYKPKTTTY
jgi:hypothetical protein